MLGLLYLVPVLSVTSAAAAVAIRSQRHGLLNGLLAAATLLYLGALLPGAVGLLAAVPVAAVTTLLGAALILAIRRLPIPPPAVLPPVAVICLAAVAACVGVGSKKPFGPDSFVRYLASLPGRLADDSAYVMQWDAVSYHLPALVEFVQSRTLWSFDGPYQSYSFGFELLSLLPLLTTGGLFGVVLANLMAVLLLLAATATLAAAMTRRLDPMASGAACVAAMLAVWGLAEVYVAQIGKNDVFAHAAGLAALAAMASALFDDVPAPASLGATLLASAAALALAIAAKPNMLGFAPAWLFGAVLLMRRGGEPQCNLLHRLTPTLAAVAVLFGCAAFFLLRNLVAFGRVLGDFGFDTGATLLLPNLSRPVLALLLEGANRTLLVLLAMATLTVAGFLAADRRRSGWPLVAAWLASGVFVFGMTPFSLYGGTAIQWRLGLTPLFLAATLVCAAALHGAAALARMAPPRLPRTPIVAAATALALAVAAASPLMGRLGLRGLPGHDAIHGVGTGVYAWLQAQPSGQRIYAAGLRPLGLYGADLGNRVFYDLHSAPLIDDLAFGRRRLVAIRQDFQPDLILLAIDPHKGPSGGFDALRGWLRDQPCVAEVFAEDKVSAFRLTPECTAPWTPDERAPLRPRMIGWRYGTEMELILTS